MKLNGLHKTVIATMMLVCLCSGGWAQTASSYFLEGSYNRYRLNPALTPERGFVALPALGGIDVEANMNAGLANFIYESKSKPGSLTTFMSSEVDSRKFLKALPDAVRLNANLDMDILSFGFGAPRWYFWLDTRLRSNQNVSIPDDMFEFMKAGMSRGEYYIDNLSVTTINYLQTALGFQIQPIENLKVGAATNILVGAAYSQANIDCLHAKLGPDKWIVNTDATLTVAVPETYVILDEDGKIDDVHNEIKNYNGPESFGVSFDLGGEYDFKDIVPGLKVSASITDVGFISWENAQVLKTDKNRYVEFGGFAEDGSTDDLGDEFEAMARFHETDDNEVITTLSATCRIGAEYHLPALDWLTFGELITMREGMNKLFESRTSVNLKAGRVLDVSGNIAFSNLGTGFGGVLNLHPGGFNLFMGLEAGSLRLNPQFIPLDKFSCNVNFGIRVGVGELRF